MDICFHRQIIFLYEKGKRNLREIEYEPIEQLAFKI
jgi:hypothetical protein